MYLTCMYQKPIKDGELRRFSSNEMYEFTQLFGIIRIPSFSKKSLQLGIIYLNIHTMGKLSMEYTVNKYYWHLKAVPCIRRHVCFTAVRGKIKNQAKIKIHLRTGKLFSQLRYFVLSLKYYNECKCRTANTVEPNS